MSIDLKFVELTADVLEIFFINKIRYTWTGGSENCVLVRSSRSGVWGGALPGTVRSLPVVAGGEP